MRARPPAGWYDDPDRHHALRYWTGNDWTPYVADEGIVSQHIAAAWTVARPPRWPHRRVARRWRIVFGALAVAGVAILAWGYLRYQWGIDARLHGADYYDYYCKNDPNGQRLMSTIGPLWLPWLGLSALAAVAWSLWYRIGRGDAFIVTMTVLGTIVVVVSFPIVGLFAGGLDCGL